MGCFSMPKSAPDKRYTPEFKKRPAGDRLRRAECFVSGAGALQGFFSTLRLKAIRIVATCSRVALPCGLR